MFICLFLDHTKASYYYWYGVSFKGQQFLNFIIIIIIITIIIIIIIIIYQPLRSGRIWHKVNF